MASSRMVRIRIRNACGRDINGIPLVQEFDYTLRPSPSSDKDEGGNKPLWRCHYPFSLKFPIPFHHPHITTPLISYSFVKFAEFTFSCSNFALLSQLNTFCKLAFELWLAD